MTVYDKDKLYKETRQIAAHFRNTLGKNIGGITSEIAAYDAARFLRLSMCENQDAGFSATGTEGERQGLKILIKGRAIFKDQKARQRIGQLNLGRDWDLMLLVLLDDDFETSEIYEASRDEVVEAVAVKEDQNSKGAMSVAKFKIIGRLVWVREEGEVADDVWDNQS